MDEYQALALDYSNKAFLLKKQVAAYVESEDDMVFWEDVFARFAPNLKIEFYYYTQEDQPASGIQEVLKYSDVANPKFILCIDSDYRYLLKEAVLNNPFLFQTYTYSIENYKCAPENLNKLVKKIALTCSCFDFIDSFHKYSPIVYPLFLYDLYRIKHRISIPGAKRILKKAISITPDLISTETTISIDFETVKQNVAQAIQIFQEQIAQFIQTSEEAIPPFIDTDWKEAMKQIEVSQTTIYWHINGHMLYDVVVKNILPKVISWERKMYKKEQFSSNSAGSCQQEGKYNKRYKNMKWETMLAINDLHCLINPSTAPLMAKIKADIDTFCQTRHHVA